MSPPSTHRPVEGPHDRQGPRQPPVLMYRQNHSIGQNSISGSSSQLHSYSTAGNGTGDATPQPTPSTPSSHTGDTDTSHPHDATSPTDNTSNCDTTLLKRMLSPPDPEIEPMSTHQDVRVFHFRLVHAKVAPLYPRLPDPSKQRNSSFNHWRNVMNKRRRSPRNHPNSHGSDGDDEQGGNNEQDGNSPDDPGNDSSSTPPSTTTTAKSRSSLPTTPLPKASSRDKTTNEQVAELDNSSHTSTKRKRSGSDNNDNTTPIPDVHVSKRIRRSIGSSPLPPSATLQRTRTKQREHDEKIQKDHVFDPKHPGSVTRERVEVKSGAKEWKHEVLHDKPWDGGAQDQ